MSDRQPIEKVLHGVQVHPLEEEGGVRSIEDVFVLVKYIDSDGDPRWAYRTSRPPNKEELLGALTVHVRLLERELVGEWEDDA